MIDLRGTQCPLTLLKIKQYLVMTKDQNQVSFVFDDPGAARDLPLYLAQQDMWHMAIEKNKTEFTVVCSRGNLK